MRRSELEHVIRAACQIARADKALVIGSQAILGTYTDDVLPPEAIRSIEVDITFLDEADDQRSDLVDGAMESCRPSMRRTGTTRRASV